MSIFFSRVTRLNGKEESVFPIRPPRKNSEILLEALHRDGARLPHRNAPDVSRGMMRFSFRKPAFTCHYRPLT